MDCPLSIGQLARNEPAGGIIPTQRITAILVPFLTLCQQEIFREERYVDLLNTKNAFSLTFKIDFFYANNGFMK